MENVQLLRRLRSELVRERGDNFSLRCQSVFARIGVFDADSLRVMSSAPYAPAQTIFSLAAMTAKCGSSPRRSRFFERSKRTPQVLSHSSNKSREQRFS